MMNEKRHKNYGHSIGEQIAFFRAELDTDAVGLWQIVPSGRDAFGLGSKELDEFVLSCIVALLVDGAVPVRHVADSDFEWDQQHQYGQDPIEIAMAIVDEWHGLPDDPIALAGGVWFARPLPGKKYVSTQQTAEKGSMPGRDLSNPVQDGEGTFVRDPPVSIESTPVLPGGPVRTTILEDGLTIVNRTLLAQFGDDGTQPTGDTYPNSDNEKPQLVADRGRYNVDLEEQDRPGHTLRDHVGKTDAELIGELERSTYNFPPFVFGRLQESSFPNRESANDFVNRSLE